MNDKDKKKLHKEGKNLKFFENYNFPDSTENFPPDIWGKIEKDFSPESVDEELEKTFILRREIPEILEEEFSEHPPISNLWKYKRPSKPRTNHHEIRERKTATKKITDGPVPFEMELSLHTSELEEHCEEQVVFDSETVSFSVDIPLKRLIYDSFPETDHCHDVNRVFESIVRSKTEFFEKLKTYLKENTAYPVKNELENFILHVENEDMERMVDFIIDKIEDRIRSSVEKYFRDYIDDLLFLRKKKIVLNSFLPKIEKNNELSVQEKEFLRIFFVTFTQIVYSLYEEVINFDPFEPIYNLLNEESRRFISLHVPTGKRIKSRHPRFYVLFKDIPAGYVVNARTKEEKEDERKILFGSLDVFIKDYKKPLYDILGINENIAKTYERTFGRQIVPDGKSYVKIMKKLDMRKKFILYYHTFEHYFNEIARFFIRSDGEKYVDNMHFYFTVSDYSIPSHAGGYLYREEVDLKRSSYIVFDYDNVKERKKFLEYVGKLPVKPCYVVDSGRGFHLWFKVERTPHGRKARKFEWNPYFRNCKTYTDHTKRKKKFNRFVEKEYEKIRLYLTAILEEFLPFEMDRHVGNPKQLIRLPGTFNPSAGKICRVVSVENTASIKGEEEALWAFVANLVKKNFEKEKEWPESFERDFSLLFGEPLHTHPLVTKFVRNMNTVERVAFYMSIGQIAFSSDSKLLCETRKTVKEIRKTIEKCCTSTKWMIRNIKLPETSVSLWTFEEYSNMFTFYNLFFCAPRGNRFLSVIGIPDERKKRLFIQKLEEFEHYQPSDRKIGTKRKESTFERKPDSSILPVVRNRKIVGEENGILYILSSKSAARGIENSTLWKYLTEEKRIVIRKGNRNVFSFLLACILKQEGYDIDEALALLKKVNFEDSRNFISETKSTVKSAYKKDYRVNFATFWSIIEQNIPSEINLSLVKRDFHASLYNRIYKKKEHTTFHLSPETKTAVTIINILSNLFKRNGSIFRNHRFDRKSFVKLMEESPYGRRLTKRQINDALKLLKEKKLISTRKFDKDGRKKLYVLSLKNPYILAEFCRYIISIHHYVKNDFVNSLVEIIEETAKKLERRFSYRVPGHIVAKEIIRLEGKIAEQEKPIYTERILS